MSSDEDDDDDPKLEWRDYIALVVAMLQTSLVGYVILIVLIVILLLIFDGIARL